MLVWLSLCSDRVLIVTSCFMLLSCLPCREGLSPLIEPKETLLSVLNLILPGILLQQ